MLWEIYQLRITESTKVHAEGGGYEISMNGIDPQQFIDCCDVDLLDNIICHLTDEQLARALAVREEVRAGGTLR